MNNFCSNANMDVRALSTRKYTSSWMEEWCGYKVFSDKKVAFHSCQRHLKKRMKKNVGRLKKIQAALDYELNVMKYIYDSFTPDELNELNLGIHNETKK